jgi:small-conductance mechanosensitive channel
MPAGRAVPEARSPSPITVLSRCRPPPRRRTFIATSGDLAMDWLAVLRNPYGFNLGMLLATLAILLASSIAISALNRLFRNGLNRIEARLHLSYNNVLLLTRILGAALWLCVGMVILDVWGIGGAGLWAFVASAVTAIGVGFLATWTMVSNLTASVFIAVWHPFRLGQSVELLPEGMKGRVIERNMMFTVLRESEGSALHIPNNFFFQKAFRVAQKGESYLFESLERELVSPPENVAAARTNDADARSASQ